MELRRRAKLWDQALSAEGPKVSPRLGHYRLDEALPDLEPTFAQATCRVVTHTKSQYGVTDVTCMAAPVVPEALVEKELLLASQSTVPDALGTRTSIQEAVTPRCVLCLKRQAATPTAAKVASEATATDDSD